MDEETLEPSPMDDPQPTNDGDQSDDTASSDADSDSDSEEEQSLQLQTLEQELYTNPSNYDAHVQYIKLLRKMGLIDKLQSARESMSSLFPLTPDMWQEWTKDEISLASGPEAVPRIEELYERGISEYLSVSLWCDYLSFITEHYPSVRDLSESGVVKARALFERALTAAGFHVNEGNRIWEAYREFEHGILQKTDDADNQAREKQIQHIRSLFHRQLSVPLVDSKSSLLAYKAWEVEQGSTINPDSADLDGIPPLVASAYQKAVQTYNARVSFEEQISRTDISDSEKLQQFMNYLKFEQSSGEPTRVQLLYERAVAVIPIASDLWLNYTCYLEQTLKVSAVLKDVYSRATKNCPWVGNLWVGYLLSLEDGHASEEEISNVFERSMVCTLSSFEEYLDVFLTRIDGLRRRLSTTSEEGNVQKLTLIRETFQRAVDYLSPHLKKTDGLLRLHNYWAQIELNFGKDFDAARRVWESLLKTSGSMLAVWQHYIAMEVGTGNIEKTRSLYRRCYSRRFDEMGSEEICASWLRFEREHGTLEDYRYATQKVAPRLEELRLFKLQQESKSVVLPADQIQSLSTKTMREKRKSHSDIPSEPPLAKKKRVTDKLVSKEDESNTSLSKKGVEMNNEKDKKVKKSDSKPILNNNTQSNFKYFTDQCTAYISKLDFKATAEDLKDLFKDVGGVKDIRIPRDKFTNKPKGMAYVEFCDDDHLAAAIAKDGETLLGRKLKIVRSRPRQERKKESVGQSSSVRTSTGSGHEDKDGARAHGVGEGDVQPKRKSMMIGVPRSLRPGLQMKNKKPGEEEGEGGGVEMPMSNNEFRKMFVKD